MDLPASGHPWPQFTPKLGWEPGLGQSKRQCLQEQAVMFPDIYSYTSGLLCSTENSNNNNKNNNNNNSSYYLWSPEVLCQVLSIDNLPKLLLKPLWDRFCYNSFLADGETEAQSS